MSFFDGFVGGAADQATGIINRQMQDESALTSQKALAEFNSELDTKKQVAMLKLRQEMADAPLNRIGAKAKEFAGQDVPVEAAPVTALSGQDPKLAENTAGTDGVTKGMVGNYADLVAMAKGLPVEEQQPYLDQLKRQFGADTETARASIIGQVRRRTSDEAMNAAAEDAKVNDPVAYAEYQARIGKPLRDERRVDNQEKREETRDTTANRRLDIQQQFNEDRAKYQDRLAEIAEARANRLEGRQGDQMDKAEMQNTRNALTSVLKDIGTQEDKIQMKMMDPMLTPDQKAILEGQFKTLDRDRLNARNELMKLAGITPPEQTPQDRPAPNQAAIDRLIKNPDKASDFDALFGKGAAASIIASQKPANTPSAQRQAPASSTDQPTGTISSSRNPQTGKTVYTVDGVRGRFNTKEEAEEAKKKSGIGKSSMSAMIDKYQD